MIKQIIILCCCIALAEYVSAQRFNVDSIIQKVAVEKDADKKLAVTTSFYTPEINNSPEYPIEIGMKLLKQAQQDKNIIEEVSAYSFLGHGYRLAGNSIKGLDYHYKAIAMAEGTGNFTLLAIAKTQAGHIYKDRGEYDKAIQLYQSSSADAEKGKNVLVRTWPLANLGSVYLSSDKLDSALMYSQRVYEYLLRDKDRNLLLLVYLNLAGIHSKLGNEALAESYYHMALKESEGTSNIRYLNLAYSGMAEHFQTIKQNDSSARYARKAIDVVNRTPFFYLCGKPAQMLAYMYENSNCDSSLKYARLFKTATDSLNSSKANQQIMLMTFDEDLRQQEVAALKIKTEEERKQNIQYALIALGIIVLLTLYLLLSRSFITNTKLITFFGVVALLIVFEFLNLLLHPFLERITHHSPVLMLLALVCIAALLVPLHHKAEHWATKKLIEKNKQIRLAAAKKTIKELDGSAGNLNSGSQ